MLGCKAESGTEDAGISGVRRVSQGDRVRNTHIRGKSRVATIKDKMRVWPRDEAG